MARLLEHYREVVVPKLQEEFSYKNPMQVPRLEKIVINMAVGKAVADSKKLTNAQAELTKLSGQKPAVCRARKSVANFKLREGMPIGCKVTLRRAAHVRVPRPAGEHRPAARARLPRRVAQELRRARQLRHGRTEQIIFPEISFDDVEETRGMDIIICTTARTDEEAKALLAGFDMPFRK